MLPGTNRESCDPCHSTAHVVDAISHALSLEILGRVAVHGEQCVSRIADALQLDISAVSRILRMLHRKRLVAARRDGTHHLYRLSRSVSVDTHDGVARLVFTAANQRRVMVELDEVITPPA